MIAQMRISPNTITGGRDFYVNKHNEKKHIVSLSLFHLLLQTSFSPPYFNDVRGKTLLQMCPSLFWLFGERAVSPKPSLATQVFTKGLSLTRTKGLLLFLKPIGVVIHLH